MFQDKNNAKPKTGISGLFDKAKNYVTDLKTTIGGSGAPENASQENASQEPVKQGNTQEQPNAPLGATWQDRIKNATASDDDIRKAAEEYKAGRYTPGPKTLEEFKKMGLLEEQEQQTTVPDNAQTTPEQPAAETPEQTQPQTPEQTQEQTPEVADNAGSNDTSNVDNGNAAGNEAATEEKVQEDTNQVQEELKSKTDDELKAYLADIDKSLNTNDEEKSKMAGIFQAYKNGDIDKNQRNYFLADAIARFANNIGEIQDTKNQNALWANITSGNQKSANVDLSPNEWQNFLKTDWQEAQKRKNEAKSKATMEKVQTDMDLLRQAGVDKYLYNEFPEMVKDSKYMKLPDDQRVAVAQMIAVQKGAPLNADQLGNAYDAVGNAILGNKIGEKTLEAMGLSNDAQKEANFAAKMNNGFLEQKNKLDIELQQKNIDAAEYANKMQEQLIKGAEIDNYILEKVKDERVKKEIIENNNKKYNGFKFKVNGKIQGLGNGVEIGGEVTGDVLANLGMDISDLIRKKLISAK